MESSNVIWVDFSQRSKSTEVLVRSKVARQAYERQAGPMDTRPKRQRTRAAAEAGRNQGLLMSFFHYHQNNSGGGFSYDPVAGISVNVVIEANSAQEADDKAESIGLYFNGCDSGYDCSCCGDRWYPQASGWGNKKGDPVPSTYGEPIDLLSPVFKKEGLGIKWISDGPEGYVHFADGRIAQFGLPQTNELEQA